MIEPSPNLISRKADRLIPTLSSEVVLREINDRIREISVQWLDTGEVVGFICECGDPVCVETVPLTRPEYDAIRADELSYVLLPGHPAPVRES